MIVLFDRAHGANVSGKQSPDGTFSEWKWSDEVIPRMIQGLASKGIQAVELVPENTEPGLSVRASRANQYVAKYGVNNVIFISVHVNAAGNGQWKSARGWSAFTSKGKTKSDDIATHLYNAAELYLKDYAKTFTSADGRQKPIRTDFSDGDPDWEENFTVLVKTKCPAVLTENLFMDNKEDLKFLQSEVGKQAIVNLHVEGIASYISALRK